MRCLESHHHAAWTTEQSRQQEIQVISLARKASSAHFTVGVAQSPSFSEEARRAAWPAPGGTVVGLKQIGQQRWAKLLGHLTHLNTCNFFFVASRAQQVSNKASPAVCMHFNRWSYMWLHLITQLYTVLCSKTLVHWHLLEHKDTLTVWLNPIVWHWQW